MLLYYILQNNLVASPDRDVSLDDSPRLTPDNRVSQAAVHGTHGSEIHGIPYPTSTSLVHYFTHFRIIWLLALIGMLVWMIVHVSLRITEFLKQPSTVHMEVKYMGKLKFPSVTICNNNYLK